MLTTLGWEFWDRTSLSSPGCFCFWYVLFSVRRLFYSSNIQDLKLCLGCCMHSWSKSSRVLEMNQDEMVSMERTDHWKIERKKMSRSMCACGGYGRCLFCCLWRVYTVQPSSTSSRLWVKVLFFALVTCYFLPNWLFQLPLEKATSILKSIFWPSLEKERKKSDGIATCQIWMS